MEIFIVDAFTNRIFGGNQAGVVLLDDAAFPEDALMQKIAAELRHSETTFVRRHDRTTFDLRYFTPRGEVPLCGHATISAFSVLRDQKIIACGNVLARTATGELSVVLEAEKVWLEMPAGEIVKTLSADEAARLYAAYNLDPTVQPANLQPAVAKVGLADILLPVDCKEALDHAIQNREAVIQLSRELGLIGVHMFFCPAVGAVTAFCRNFAPLFGIDEEAATGTSNAALSYYLYTQGLIAKNSVNAIVQGQALGKPSSIYSKIANNGVIWIGGSAVVSMRGSIAIESVFPKV
ncbi:MAG: PhzF family phenazine biosynthesis protein [Christensenella sp.]|nr:PhzF family phenazine biosynthesis protein [Christensenella sp.]